MTGTFRVSLSIAEIFALLVCRAVPDATQIQRDGYQRPGREVMHIDWGMERLCRGQCRARPVWNNLRPCSSPAIGAKVSEISAFSGDGVDRGVPELDASYVVMFLHYGDRGGRTRED